MSESPEDEDDDDPDVDGVEDENDDEEETGGDEPPIFLPPEDDEYEPIKYFQGLQSMPEVFGDLTRTLLKNPMATFAARLDVSGGGMPLDEFQSNIGRIGRLSRWVSNSTTPQSVGWPLVLATLPTSLTIHFGRSPEEEPRRMGNEQLYPSTYGARAIGRILAYTEDRDLLLPAVAPLQKRAVKTLLETLEEVEEEGIAIDWLTSDGLYSRVTPEHAAAGVSALDSVPAMETKYESFLGFVDEPSHANRTVRLEPLKGRPFLVRFAPRHEETLREAWGKYMSARIRVEVPEFPSLPRAPRRRRTISSIKKIHEALPVDGGN